MCRVKSEYKTAFRIRGVAAAPHVREIPDEIPPHKMFEYSHLLEYTRGNLTVGTRSFSA